MRWSGVLLLLVVGCASSWERHKQQLAEHEAQGEYAKAAADERWLIDNAFVHAPASEQSPAAEAKRYLRLADLAAKTGNSRLAVEALREAMMADPLQGAAVRAQLEQLPLSPGAIGRLRREFAWNIDAMVPADDAQLSSRHDDVECWSYQVREVRIRVSRTVSTPDGMQRQVTYDARPWSFDVASKEWRCDGAWELDAGTEVEMVKGPSQPRYRALMATDGRFVADDTVPRCHQAAWRGPYDTRGTVFVAPQLPMAHPDVPE